jgi:FkbM family methyltransferase
MTYRIPLPAGGRSSELDIVEPFTTMVQRQLRRVGLSSYEPATAATLLSLFEREDDGFVFLDVGANVGLYSSMCASMFRPGAVHAFEPAPLTADVAERIIAANDLDVRVFRVAASDRAGSAGLHLSAVSDASHSLMAGFRETSGVVQVPTVRLDDHVASTGLRPAVVKIDVETHEGAVLAGAATMMARDRPALVVEVLAGRAGRDFAAEVMAAMDGLGYHFYELPTRPTFEPVDGVRSGRSGSRDWLLTPETLPEDFGHAWERWSERLAACTPDRNSRVAAVAHVRAALNRGGVSELASTIKRAVARRTGARASANNAATD